MWSKLRTGPKVIILIAVVLAVVFGLKTLVGSGLIPVPGMAKSAVAQKVTTIDTKEAAATQGVQLALPGAKAANVPATRICGSIWAWNAQMGLIFANGGAGTTEGSLMAKRGVNLSLRRQDDTGKMQEELIKCAKEIAGGASQCDCSSGANFVILMGGGVGQFISGINPQLAKLGANYTAKVIGAVGRSFGEDTFMAPPEVREDPKKAKGLVCSGVIRDDDWHLAVKWAADNEIPINPDEKTYDPEAINWVNSPDYTAAAQAYVNGQPVELKEVRNGRPTGKTVKKTVECTVTWTPGDVTAAKKKGGLVKIVSTKHYLMPSVIVGPKAFFEKNRAEVQGLLAAVMEAGDQIKTHDQALRKAAELSAKVYAEEDGRYWYNYYKGQTEKDATGVSIDLGGSAAWNLIDVLNHFGMLPGKNDNFRSVYTTFAGYDTFYYPALFKDTPIPDVKDVEDKSFIRGAQDLMENASQVATDETKFEVMPASATRVAKRSYRFNFEVGKATLTPEGQRQLALLKDSLAVTNLFVKVDGHTDNTGNERDVNLPLSEARAQAVKQYLQRSAPETFPNGRFAIAGHGSAMPIAPNTTSAGRAQNRRVEIELLSN